MPLKSFISSSTLCCLVSLLSSFVTVVLNYFSVQLVELWPTFCNLLLSLVSYILAPALFFSDPTHNAGDVSTDTQIDYKNETGRWNFFMYALFFKPQMPPTSYFHFDPSRSPGWLALNTIFWKCILYTFSILRVETPFRRNLPFTSTVGSIPPHPPGPRSSPWGYGESEMDYTVHVKLTFSRLDWIILNFEIL